MKYIYLIISIIICNSMFGVANNISEQDSISEKIVYQFDIKQEIGPAIWRQTKQAFLEAEKINADLIVLRINTYGGLVDAADSIRTTILNCKIPVYAFIDNNAASAGALISIACNKIFMRKGANFGAATVVNQTGEAMPDKYQSYMRSTMRSTAESHGKDTIITNGDTTYLWKRNPLIAEAMVDPRTFIEGIIDTGKVLTFTTEEAINNNYCNGIAENVYELLKMENFTDYKIVEYKITETEKVIGFLINPYLQSILIMIIIGGIYFELQTTGVGFAIAASIIAAVLYFSPLYIEGLAENWEILIFIVGVILVAIEIFAIPGFGVAGISGIFLIIFGLTLSMVDNFGFEFNAITFQEIIKSLFLVMFSIFSSLILSIYFGKKILDSSKFNFLVLSKSQIQQDGYIGVNTEFKKHIGTKCIAATDLRTVGKVLIDNEMLDAKSMSGYIEKGTEVIVVKFESAQLYVRKV